MAGGDARPGPSRPRAAPPGRLPVPGDMFVGRAEELAALGRLLADPDCRLLTLTGPPGIGKTRLAVRAASAWAGTADRVVVLVELAEVRDPGAVVAALATALGVDRLEPSSFADVVADLDGPVLAVLDNFEHLLAAAPDVGSVLAQCPALRVLVTSRERLRLSEEREFPVAPLPVPSPADAKDLSAIAANPCVSLLLDRARRVRPQFALTAANAPSVIAACVRLEGIPLALELAATRLKVMSPDQLVSRLGGQMWLLQNRDRNAATRHRALSAAIAWSYDLLDPGDRALFDRLSVFAGSWGVDDVAGVCGLAAEDALLRVESLLDKSLIERVDTAEGPARFRMLESLREYAAQRLADSGSTASAAAGHMAYYAALAEQFETAIGLPGEREAVAALGHHQANLRAALDRSLADGASATTLPLAAAVGWYCYTRGAIADGRQLLDRALAADPDHAGDPYPAALLVAGILAWGSGELVRAESLLNGAVERCGRAGDARRETIASAFLGHVARAAGRFGEAARWHQRAELGYRQMHNPQGSAWVRYDLGLLARDRGDLAVAEQLLRESLREFRDLDYPWAVASAAWGLGVVLCARGAVDEAAALLGEALTLYRDQHDAHGVTQCLEALAFVACDRSAHASAAMLLGYAAAQRRHLEAPLSEADRSRSAAVEAALIGALGPAAAERARQDGRLLGIRQAVALGHATADGQTVASTSAPSTVLTRRETQVATLVAAGRTNRQIGSALGIAEKTAEVHLQHVMAKVGAHNRAEVAVWAVRQGLPGPE